MESALQLYKSHLVLLLVAAQNPIGKKCFLFPRPRNGRLPPSPRSAQAINPGAFWAQKLPGSEPGRLEGGGGGNGVLVGCVTIEAISLLAPGPVTTFPQRELRFVSAGILSLTHSNPTSVQTESEGKWAVIGRGDKFRGGRTEKAEGTGAEGYELNQGAVLTVLIRSLCREEPLHPPSSSLSCFRPASSPAASSSLIPPPRSYLFPFFPRLMKAHITY